MAKRFSVSLSDDVTKLLDQIAAGEDRDRSGMISHMVKRWDTLVKSFNEAGAPAPVAPTASVAGEVAPAGEDTSKPKVAKRPGRKSERPPYVYDPTAAAKGLPAYGKTTTFTAKMYYPKPSTKEQTIVPVQIVTSDGEPVRVRVRKDIMALLEGEWGSPDPDEGIRMCAHLQRSYHHGIAERFETLEELLERVREVGPTEDWIDEDDTQPTTPAEPEDDSLDDILGALDGDDA